MTVLEKIEEISLDEKQKMQILNLMTFAFINGKQFEMVTKMRKVKMQPDQELQMFMDSLAALPFSEIIEPDINQI